MQFVAVDWSGRKTGAEEFIWLARVQDGRLVELANGRARDAAVRRVVEIARGDPRTVAGFDFAFSFPAWWCEQRGWARGEDVWRAMDDCGEALLDACDYPFWGRRDRRNRLSPDRLYRRADREAGGHAKSVFQVGGAGAVGTGSIRGMPHLLMLVREGFSVWPFTPDGWPRAVEIYPRALTGPVTKSREAERRAYLSERFGDQPAELLERAAGSEDAFDAAVSALVMAAHGAELEALTRPGDPVYATEGSIWRPA